MTEERRVDMVRLVGEERLYDREALLGRDTSSVFPSLARQQEQDDSGAGAGAILEALGARKFISETELESLRATRGVTADDGAVAVDKPLAEILRERKAAKDAEHEEKWKLMKIGKNRPLDPEELQFLDSVVAAEAERERAWSEMERAELEAFKAAVRERSTEAEAGPGPAPAPAATAGLSTKADSRVPSVVAAGAAVVAAPKPVLRPLVKVKPKAAAAAAKDAREGAPAGPTPSPSKHTHTATATSTRAATAAGAGASEPPAKKAKTGGGDVGDVGDDENDGGGGGGGAGGEGSAGVSGAGPAGGGVLAALMGGYGSDSDPDSDPGGR